ncbi:MAG TPA: BBE domain-containing protein, partial [Thermomicrobiales bacterium]|nr:BBE domain-containing protein [Thermomicrobiales bacterium]
LTVPFGDSASVGVGGITLGGGIGVLARTMGLISDNLTRVEMVVAAGERDASLIVADAYENPELFWACRGGGGGSFGVATAFTFALHPVSDQVPIYDVYWGWDDAATVLETWQRLAPEADERFGSMLELFSKSVGRHRMHGVFLGTEDDLRQILQPLLAIGAPDVTIKTVPYLDATRFLTDSPAARHAVDRSPLNIKFSSAWALAPLSRDAIERCCRYLENESADAFSMFFLNMGGAMRRLSADATAFPHRRASFYLEWDARWTRPASEGAAVTAVELMRLALQPFVTGSYVNVPDPGIPDWQDAYFGANAPRLRRVKAQYDPNNVFRFAQSIPPEE